jgi:hypothetical protein
MIRIAAMAGLAFLALALAGAAPAQELSPELQALDAKLPGTLVSDPTRLDWATQGAGFKSKGIQDPAIPGGGAAVQFEIPKSGPQLYSIQAFVPLLGKIVEGKTYTIGFYARTLSAETADGKGVIGVRFQQNSAPWQGFGDATVKDGSEWEWHEVSGVATINVSKQDAVVALQLAGAKQTIEIGQAIVVEGAAKILGAAAPADPTAAIKASLEATTDLPPPLKGAGRLIDRPAVRDWGNSGPPGSYAQLDDKTIWLGKATRYTVGQKGQNRWEVAASIPLGEGIADGDKLVIAFAAKTVSASTADGNALVGVRLQNSDPPYAGFADHLVAVGPNWQLIRIATTATQAIPAGKATLALQFAEAPQVVDVGPVYVFKPE